ncbi:MAG: hypothetical protein P4M11_07175 [Candidatus Pacebacteria bacterium]|nr:hypothetical protein [Candidatus Paceibacterota bacterium]
MEEIIPLLGALYTETNADKRREIESTLQHAGTFLCDKPFRLDQGKLLGILLQVVVSPLNVEPMSKDTVR